MSPQNTTYASYEGILFTKDLSALLFIPENMEHTAYLPDTTKTVPAGALSHSAQLTFVSIGESCSTYATENGILYSKDKTTLIATPAGYKDSVVIPQSVTTIAPYAFAGCNLKSIVATGNITSIDATAFSDATKAEATIVIPSSPDFDTLKAVWVQAGFTHFQTPATPGDTTQSDTSQDTRHLVYELQDDYTLSVAWKGNSVPDANLTIPSSAELSSVTYRVSTVADSAFENCTSLKSVVIPSSISSIGDSAFKGCSQLESVSLEEGTSLIGGGAFENTAVKEMILPASIVSIEERAFASCEWLKCVVALSDVLLVAPSVIEDCTGLTVMTPYRDDNVYLWNPGIAALGNHVQPFGVVLPDEALLLKSDISRSIAEGGITQVPEGCELSYSYSAAHLSVGEDGIVSARAEGVDNVLVALSYDGIVLAHAIRDVEVVSMRQEETLRATTPQVSLPAKIPFTDVDLSLRNEGVLLMADPITFVVGDLKYTILQEGGTAETNKVSVAANDKTTISGPLLIPETVANNSVVYRVTMIEGAAFQGCANLTGSIVIPKYVTMIGYWAFLDCSGFTGSLVISDSVISIDAGAFQNCSGLTGSLAIPNSVTKMGVWAFSGCSGFDGELIISNSLTVLEERVFQNCSGLSGSIAIPNSVTAIKEGAFWYCWRLTGSLSIPDSVTIIEENAFNNCFNLTGLVAIPNSVTTIGRWAFLGCSRVEKVSIGASVKAIGEGVFNFNTSLKSISSQGAITSVDSNAFVDIDKSLVTVHLPKGIDNIVWKNAGFLVFADLPEVSISFNAKGGAPEPVVQKVPLGGMIHKPIDPEKIGYTFLGWYTDAGCTGSPWIFIAGATADMTLFAGWKLNTYTFTFNGNGGSPAITTKIYSYGSVVGVEGKPTDPLMVGHDFQGWFTAASGGIKYNFNATVTADMTLWAQWKPKTYVVTFYTNAESGTVQKTVDHGSAVSPPSVTKLGHTLAGWYTDVSLTTPYNVSTPAVGNLELWAKWTGNPYTIFFDPNGSLGPTTSQDMTHGVKATLKPNTFIPLAGSRFVGWNTRADGLGDAYSDQVEVLDLAQGATDITLYAQWTENTYTIEFVPNPGTHPVSGTMAKIPNVKYSQVLTLPSSSFSSSDGYVFAYWTGDSEGTGTRYLDASQVSKLGGSTRDGELVRLYAQWKGSPYTITYDPTTTDVEGSLDPQVCSYGTWEILASSGFTKPNSTLSGWALNKADAEHGFADYKLGDQVLDLAGGTDTVVLYAVWTEQINVSAPINPTITLDAQGKPSADTSTYFESSTSKAVRVVSATCSPITGEQGTIAVFPKEAQWDNIAVALKSTTSATNRLFLTGLTTPLQGLSVPAKSGSTKGELPVTINLTFLDDVDITYNPDSSHPVAQITFVFEMGA